MVSWGVEFTLLGKLLRQEFTSNENFGPGVMTQTGHLASPQKLNYIRIKKMPIGAAMGLLWTRRFLTWKKPTEYATWQSPKGALYSEYGPRNWGLQS